MGLSHAHEGNIQRAEQLYREVLKDAEHVDGDCRDATCLAAALLGEALYERNEACAKPCKRVGLSWADATRLWLNNLDFQGWRHLARRN